MCVSPGEAKDAIEEETACASVMESPTLGYDTHGDSTTKQDSGEEARESYGKTSFFRVLRSQKSFMAQGNLWQSVHIEGGQAVNLKVFLGGVPLSFVCA